MRIRSGPTTFFAVFDDGSEWTYSQPLHLVLTSGLIGSIAPCLATFGSEEDRRENKLRRTHFYPLSEDTIELARRFDFEYLSGYGMTELPMAMITDIDSQVLGSCGKPRSGIQCRLVDDHDQEVAPGEVGELIARSDHPWSLTHGYFGMPDATADAWRNGWFHTGPHPRPDPC